LKIFVNLATLRRGGGMTHVRSFLPELIDQLTHEPTLFVNSDLKDWAYSLSSSVITHDTPPGSLKLAYVQQWQVRKLARDHDVLLSVMNTGPIMAATPQIVWCCNVLHFVRAKTLVGKIQNLLTMLSMNSSELCIFPSKTASRMATDFGFNNKGIVIKHPIRDHDAVWNRKTDPDGLLHIFVPSSHQPHKNLSLIPEISSHLNIMGIPHRFNITLTEYIAPGCLRNMDSTIKFIGRYSEEELAGIINGNDVALIPSLYESYSYSLVELEMMGMPIAASAIPVHQELSSYASLFEPCSPESAANSIRLAIDQSIDPVAPHPCAHTPSEYAKLTINASKTVARKH